MNQKEALKLIYPDKYISKKNTDLEKVESNGYKTASAEFNKLLNAYKIDVHIFKGENNSEKYDFDDKDIEFLKVISKLYELDPANGKNYDEGTIITAYKSASEFIEEIINHDEFPLLKELISGSLQTQGFLSVTTLINLVTKIITVFQAACVNDMADYNIYSELNGYLDQLLYTYEGNNVLNNQMNLPIMSVHVSNRNELYYGKVNKFQGLAEYIDSIVKIYCEEKN